MAKMGVNNMLQKKWLVVVKEYYYPSVFEFDNEEDALKKYREEIHKRSVHDGDEDCKVFLARSNRYIGKLEPNVDW